MRSEIDVQSGYETSTLTSIYYSVLLPLLIRLFQRFKGRLPDAAAPPPTTTTTTTTILLLLLLLLLLLGARPICDAMFSLHS